jgi:hypothetical protein
MYTAYTDLPEPSTITAAGKTGARLAFPGGEKIVFVHVRSANAHGDLSLPSLPEIRLEVAEE